MGFPLQSLRQRIAELAFILADHGTRWDELWTRLGFTERTPPVQPDAAVPATPAARVMRSLELAAALRARLELDAREFDDELLLAYANTLDRCGTVSAWLFAPAITGAARAGGAARGVRAAGVGAARDVRAA
jgi:hypothetical protein